MNPNNSFLPTSKLTPHQIISFNKLNPYIIEKDFSITPSSNLTYKEVFTRYFRNNAGSLTYLNKSELKTKNKFLGNKRGLKNNFHTNCPLTKKKKCWCSYFNDPKENKISSFINKLHKGEIEIDVSEENLKIKKSKKFEEKKEKIKNEQNLIDEQIKIINFNEVNKSFFAKLNEKNLLIKDYKDIERKINEDKKKCQKCGNSLNGEEPRKGWKNEFGEYTLLCNYCAKKLYDGASEVRYDSYNNDSSNSNQGYYMNTIRISGNNNYMQNRNGPQDFSRNYYSGNNFVPKMGDNFKNNVGSTGFNNMVGGHFYGGVGGGSDGKPKFVSFQVQKNDTNK